MANWIAITAGDVTGIGPEVALKAVAAELARDSFHYLLIGDPGYLRDLNKKLQLGLSPGEFNGYESKARVTIHSPSTPLAARLPSGSPEAARAAVAFLR